MVICYLILKFVLFISKQFISIITDSFFFIKLCLAHLVFSQTEVMGLKLPHIYYFHMHMYALVNLVIW